MKIYDILDSEEKEFYQKHIKGFPKAETKFVKSLFKKKWWKVIESGFLKIKTEDMQLVPFVANEIQKQLIDRVRRLEEKNSPVRIIIPKSRRQGISTVVEAIIYAKTAFSENVDSIIIADETKKSSKIFSMSKLMDLMFPPEIATKIDKSNARELSFSEIHSRIEIDTAENRDAGRTGNFHNAHLSEFAYFPHPEELMNGLAQTVPDLPGTMIIYESTGNGIGNMFHDLCMKAENGEMELEIFFIPWFDSKKYRLELGEYDENLEAEIMNNEYLGKYGDEKYYYETFNLSLAQMKWRRHAITNKCFGNLQNFMQEYPAILSEVFQSSGNPVFSIPILEKIQATYTRPEKYRAMYIYDETTGKGKLKKSDNGYVKIWNDPEKDWKNRYLLFADTGGMWGDEIKGADFSYAAVYDRMERKIVASVRGHFAATFFSKIIVHLARTYSDSLLVIEINKYASETDEHGVSVLDRIRDNLDYHNLYYRKTLDRKLNKETDQLGFHMNTKTKALIVDGLVDYVKDYVDEDIQVNDSGIIDEMKTFIISQTKTGRTTWKAQEGCKDDRVDVFGGILYISSTMPDWERQKVIVDEHETHTDLYDYI